MVSIVNILTRNLRVLHRSVLLVKYAAQGLRICSISAFFLQSVEDGNVNGCIWNRAFPLRLCP